MGRQFIPLGQTPWMTPGTSWRSGATITTPSDRTRLWETRRRSKRAGRLSNLRAPRPARLPRTTSQNTNLKPADSRYERGTGRGQVTSLRCPRGPKVVAGRPWGLSDTARARSLRAVPGRSRPSEQLDGSGQWRKSGRQRRPARDQCGEISCYPCSRGCCSALPGSDRSRSCPDAATAGMPRTWRRTSRLPARPVPRGRRDRSPSPSRCSR